MATILDMLADILNPNPGQNRLVAPNANGPNYLTQTGLSQDQLARFHQMSGMGGQAAPATTMPQEAPPAAIGQPQAPQPDQTQTASVAPPQAEGGGFLSRLFGGGQSAGENQTIQWLQQQGMDPGTATMMAKSKPILQQYLLQRSQGKKPIEIAGKLVDPDTYKVIADFSNPQDAGFTLGEGQKRYDAQGKLVASGPDKALDKPSIVQEYEYAKNQGFPGTLADWEASKKGGMSLQVDPNTGEVTFQQGGNIKPLTEAQSKDTNFAVRAEGSLPALEKYGNALTNLQESTAGSIPVIGNYFKSNEYQQAEQAGTEFLTAILRKDSGAVIGADELQTYGRTYLPQPGDGPDLLTQKQASRARALQGLKAGMTPQAILAQEKALRNGEAPPPAGPATSGDDAPPPSYTGKNWKFMTPEQRKLWQ